MTRMPKKMMYLPVDWSILVIYKNWRAEISIDLSMKLIFLLMMSLLTMPVDAQQDKWVVYINKQLVLDAAEESKEKNVVSVKASSLRSKINEVVFRMIYMEGQKQKGWSRSMMIFDSSDHELKRYKGSRLNLTNTNLLAMLKKTGKLDIYTVSLPDDPSIRERIRVRRVHLCTLVLE
jgi:hypothetical protein